MLMPSFSFAPTPESVTCILLSMFRQVNSPQAKSLQFLVQCDRREYADMILEEAEKMDAMVRDMLELSRL